MFQDEKDPLLEDMFQMIAIALVSDINYYHINMKMIYFWDECNDGHLEHVF